MGLLDIQSRGWTTFGEIGEQWTLSYNTSPMNVSDGAGAIGSLTFRARCDSDSIFSIDDYLSVAHFADDGVTRWLSTFDVNITRVSTDDKFASVSSISRIAELDVIRQAAPNPSGTYERTFKLPPGLTYTISGTTYTTRDNPTIYGVASQGTFAYVLAAGVHDGEVVYVMEIDGRVRSVWPVYSDATDLATPGSRYIAYANSYVYVGQVNANRIKRFIGATGNFQNQFGSAGSGNGQFTALSDISANGSAVFATDSALGRVQRFSPTGTYQMQFGASGTGIGWLEFNAPDSITVTNSYVYIADAFARVREYDLNGNFRSQPAGGWDFDNSAPLGPFAASSRIGIAFDQLGSMYCMQSGVVWKFIPDFSNSTSISDFTFGSWPAGSFSTGSDISAIAGAGTSGTAGEIYVVGQSGVEQYAGSLSSVRSALLYYIALAVADFPVRMLDINDSSMDLVPSLTGRTSGAGYPAWEMSVWRAICELCAATGNSTIAFDSWISFVKRDDSYVRYRLPDDILPDPLTLDSRSGSRNVAAVNQNARRKSVRSATSITDASGLIYSAINDNNRTFNANVGSLDTIILDVDAYPELILDPRPVGTATNPFGNPDVANDLSFIAAGFANGSGTLSRSTSVLLSGNPTAAATFTVGATQTGSFIGQRVAVNPGQVYDFRVWARGTGADQQMFLFVDWRNSAGVNVGYTQGLATTVSGTTFTQLRGDPAPPPGGSTYAWVKAQVHSSGRAWLNGEVMRAGGWTDGPYGVTPPTYPTLQPGEYMVLDANNSVIPPSSWKAAGGYVAARLGSKPGQIVLTITGPGVPIPGTQGPYRIAGPGGTGGLTIVGQGVICTPANISVGTGVAEHAARTDTISISSPFIVNADIAYTEASWTAYSNSPSQGFSFQMRNDKVPVWVSSSISGQGGTAHLVGMLFRYRDAIYAIISVQSDNAFTTITATRRTPVSTAGASVGALEPGFEGLWNGRTAGEFDAYWSGRPAEDFTIAPLEAPFVSNGFCELVGGLYPSASLYPSSSLFPDPPEMVCYD